MKKELPPAVIISVLVVVGLAVGIFFFMQATVNPHTPRPQMYGGMNGSATPKK